jgi:hypothetical protein
VKSGLSIRLAGAGLCALVFGSFGAAPAAAQAYRYGAGWTTGGSDLTALNPEAGGAQALDPDIGFLFGLHLERGYGSSTRFVVRYQGTYFAPEFQWSAGERRIDAASLDVSALMRLLNPTVPTVVMPYLMAGAGGIWYDLGTGPSTSFPVANAYHDGESRVLPLVAFGVGVDSPIGVDWDGWPIRLRFELADHMTFGSPLLRVTDRERYGAVHHLRFTIGAYSAVGLIR